MSSQSIRTRLSLLEPVIVLILVGPGLLASLHHGMPKRSLKIFTENNIVKRKKLCVNLQFLCTKINRAFIVIFHGSLFYPHVLLLKCQFLLPVSEKAIRDTLSSFVFCLPNCHSFQCVRWTPNARIFVEQAKLCWKYILKSLWWGWSCSRLVPRDVGKKQRKGRRSIPEQLTAAWPCGLAKRHLFQMKFQHAMDCYLPTPTQDSIKFQKCCTKSAWASYERLSRVMFWVIIGWNLLTRRELWAPGCCFYFKANGSRWIFGGNFLCHSLGFRSFLPFIFTAQIPGSGNKCSWTKS